MTTARNAAAGSIRRNRPRGADRTRDRTLLVPATMPVILFLIGSAGGCAAPGRAGSAPARQPPDRRAVDVLKAALRYEANPVVRVEAVEALESYGDPSVLPWLRSALLDGHPAVRFAACVALGRLKDHVATGALRNCAADEDPSVRAAALFALHRLGHPEGTGRLATFLLTHKEATVRRNAALLLGLMEEPGAIRILAKAMKDPDAGVRQHALEAMARLGNAEARQELVFMTNAGVGSERSSR